MKKGLIYTTCLTLLILIFGIKNVVHAKSNALLATPAVWEIRMKPGVQYRLKYQVSSADPEKQYVVRIVGIKKTASGYLNVANLPSGIRADLEEGEWGVPQRFEKTDELAVTLAVGSATKPQDIYIAVQIESVEQPTQPGGVAIQVTKSLLLPIYVSILDQSQTAQGVIEQVMIHSPIQFSYGDRNYAIVDSFLPIPITITASNTGRHFVAMQSRMYIKGEKTKQSILLEKTRLLAQETSRLQGAKVACGWWYCPPDPSYVLQGSYIGSYEVRVEGGLGVRGQSVSKSAYFVALPLLHGGGVLFLIIIGVLYHHRIHRKKKNTQ